MKKMNKGMLMAALICGVVQWGGTPVHASELQEFALDEYVVTAARTETKLVDTPANISVVDAQTIEERHYQDVSEVLKDVPGANVLDTGTGAYEKKIALNGDERVLILVDGRRLNFDMGSMSRSGYDMNQLPDVGLIERIEVLKGAGGALYGSDAVGGVVNIITKKADRSYGKVSLGYGSNGSEDYKVLYSFKEGSTGVSLAASKYEQDYYKYKDAKTNTTKRWPTDSNFKNEKISLKVDQELSKIVNMSVGYDYSNFEGRNPSNADAYYSNDLDKKTENMYLKLDWFLKENDEGYFQIYHNELKYSNVGIDPIHPDWSSFGSMTEKTDGFDAQQVFTVTDNNKFVIGASWRDTEVINDGLGSEYDESIDNLALFINDTWDFAPTWTLNFGVRYDDHSNAGEETTFSTGLNKKFNEHSHAYFNWGEVFRAPTTDDLFHPMGGLPGRKLVAETGETWTIGYQTRFNDKTDFNMNYFESDLDDAIGYNPDNNYTCENYAKQEKKGMEISLNHEINDNVNLVASYTYVKTKNDKNDGRGFLRDENYVPNIYRLGLNYKDGKWNGNVWLRAGSGASATRYVDSRYMTIDLAITYQATDDLSFYAKGYNLTNESYAEIGGHNDNGSYNYPAQSRRFIVGAEYKF